MNIEKVGNGYLVTLPGLALADERLVYKTIEEVLDAVLFHFEHKTHTFTGSSYAKITVSYERPEEKV